MVEIVGSIHIHSDYSDGSRAIEEIVEFGKSLNLDYLMFTDHNTLKPKLDGLEGVYENVLVMIGCELNDKEDKNHYLVFDVDDEIKNNHDASLYVKEVFEKGGIGIVAHPDEEPPKLKSYFGCFPWTDWNVSGLKIIEIWNQMSEWKEGMNHFNAVWQLLHPRKSLKGPKSITLKRWDELNKKDKVFAVGGVDAHSVKHKLFKFIPLRIYPYKVCFKTIRTHLWVEDNFKKLISEKDFKTASRMFYDSFKNGKMFISNHNLGDAKGFRYFIKNSKGKFTSGDNVTLDNETLIDVLLPAAGEIRIIKDGQVLDIQRNVTAKYKLDNPGFYRLEVYRKGKPWIFSNPIWVV
jgi:hypothetical protein